MAMQLKRVFDNKNLCTKERIFLSQKILKDKFHFQDCFSKNYEYIYIYIFLHSYALHIFRNYHILILHNAKRVQQNRQMRHITLPFVQAYIARRKMHKRSRREKNKK